jgi:hypothetical protein
VAFDEHRELHHPRRAHARSHRALVGRSAIYDVRFVDTGEQWINVDGANVLAIQLVGQPERVPPPRAIGRPILRVVRS